MIQSFSLSNKEIEELSIKINCFYLNNNLIRKQENELTTCIVCSRRFHFKIEEKCKETKFCTISSIESISSNSNFSVYDIKDNNFYHNLCALCKEDFN